jgi:NhaP-type Na+/H+ or K+/H+ antiporter
MKLLLSLIMMQLCVLNTSIVAQDNHASNDINHTEIVNTHESETASTEEHHEEHATNHSHPDTSMLFFVIIAIFIGAATRHFLKKIPIPFTALLLVIGILLGVFARLGYFESWGGMDVSYISESLYSAAHIDPHLLLYVFLPILIFEAAFAMDLHTFKRSAGNSVILAVPGILLALILSAGLVFGLDYFDLGLSGWGNWSLALMFGAVISATDPVAVVALLKDLGASKKLGTLIEGESLLNDGTAIVIFMVFFSALSGNVSDTHGVIQFLIVSFGGIGVGLIIGWIMMKWISKVNNDAMVEISLVAGAAYLTFYVAEQFLHVSGVLALVSLGIMIGGIGRAKISPKVEHFMHEFWELAGFIANCIIFLIVGLVVAARTEFTANDFLMLIIVYIGIHVIRALVIFICYPFMKNTGYGLPVKDAIVVWYGALRGAIGLALALIVVGIDSNALAENMGVTLQEAETIKGQFLFLIAGTVTLTLLVNATTIKALLKYLGLLDVAPIKKLMLQNANNYLYETSEKQISRMQGNRFLKKANWDSLQDFLPSKPTAIPLKDDAEFNALAEGRRRVLEKEKSSYWHQFKNGTLDPKSAPALIEDIDKLLDLGGKVSLAERNDLEQSWEAPKWMVKFSKSAVLKRLGNQLLLQRLESSYDSAVGFINAQDECLSLLNSMARSEELPAEDLKTLEQEVNENKIEGQSFIRNLRTNFPDIFEAVSTTQAIRQLLRYEEQTIERLQKKGRIDAGEAGKMLNNLSERKKKMLGKKSLIKRNK